MWICWLCRTSSELHSEPSHRLPTFLHLLLFFRKLWLKSVGSPSSRIDRAVFSNERDISKQEIHGFSTRYWARSDISVVNHQWLSHLQKHNFQSLIVDLKLITVNWSISHSTGHVDDWQLNFDLSSGFSTVSNYFNF